MCPSLDVVVEEGCENLTTCLEGRGRVSLGARLGKEAEVIKGFVTGDVFRCGLYVQSRGEAVRRIAAYCPGSKDLKLLPRYVEDGMCPQGEGLLNR